MESSNTYRAGWVFLPALVAMSGLLSSLAGCDESLPRYVVVSEEPFVQILTVTGRLVPALTVEIESQVSGRLISTPVDDGDRVEAGDVIAILDDSDARQRIVEGRSSLVMAHARARALTEVALPATREELTQLQLNRVQIERNLVRQEALHAQGSIRLDGLEDTRTALALLDSRIRLAQVSLNSRESGGAEAAETAAAVGQARASLAGLERELEKFVLRAPIDGIVLERRVEPGEIMQPGKVLLMLATDERVLAEVDLDERVVGLVAPGQKARLWPEAFPLRAVVATVLSVGPRVHIDTGTVRVRLSLDEPASFPIQDLTIRAEIRVRELDRALIIERSFLWKESPPVVLLRSDGRLVERPISIERVGVTDVLVLDGLLQGEVIVDPAAGLEPGDAVALSVPENGAAPR